MALKVYGGGVRGYIIIEDVPAKTIGFPKPAHRLYYAGGGKAIGTWVESPNMATVFTQEAAMAKASSYDFKRSRAVPDPLGRTPNADAGGRKTVDRTNYFDSTIATFQKLADPGPQAEAMWSKLKSQYSLDHVSDYGSQYLTDGVRLWRYADHWGTFASVTWHLSPPAKITGNVKVFGGKQYHGDTGGRDAIGVVPFSQMKRK